MAYSRRLIASIYLVATLLTGLPAAFASGHDEPTTVLITGANRGIGIEFAKQYAELGWHVIATCRNPAKAEQLKTLAEQYSNVHIRQLDLTDHARIEQLAAELEDQPIDILLNNAALLGDMKSQLFGQIDYEQFSQILAVNTIGTMKLTETFSPNVLAGQEKKIITLGSAAGSIASINGHPDLYAYRASKAALHLLIRNLSFELADEGVIVGLINPGLVDTRGFADMLSGKTETPEEFQQIVNLLRAGVIQLSTPEAAVKDMITLISELEPEQSGVFLNADGTALPW
jgi:NAD(P)-dependent dehydrogenase (short-subunit alcohol dehydrogenase family)